METDEIVRALRENVGWCGANEYEIPLCMGDNQREAADLIESLQARLADYHHMSELVDGKMEENQRLRRINENLQEQLAEKIHIKLRTDEDMLTPAEAIETINRLRKAYRKTTAQLNESQRREQAAVEDLKRFSACCQCNANIDGSCCDMFDGTAENKYFCSNWQWRGPQEAGKEGSE